MHVAEAGAGEPIVLLHGWPQHWYCWRKVIPALAREHRVICPDLRGHGWTDAPPGTYEKEQFATDLLNLLDALELERVRLVGHDWGGFAGFLACLRAPERFERFLALDIVHPWMQSDAKNAWRGLYQVPIATPGLGPMMLRSAPQLIERLLSAAAATPDTFSDADLKAYSERFRDPDRAEATSRIYRTFQLRELRPILGGRYRSQRLTVPTLLLVAGKQTVITDRMLEGYEEHTDTLRLEHVDGAGHFIPEDCPDVLAERALRFFAR